MKCPRHTAFTLLHCNPLAQAAAFRTTLCVFHIATFDIYHSITKIWQKYRGCLSPQSPKGYLDYWSYVNLLRPNSIVSQAENDYSSCYQDSIIHMFCWDRLVHWPRAKEDYNIQYRQAKVLTTMPHSPGMHHGPHLRTFLSVVIVLPESRDSMAPVVRRYSKSEHLRRSVYPDEELLILE